MNIQDYISSGVLESYVMGELTEQEMRKVQCMALVHEEIEAELKAIESTYEQMAMDTAVAPSDELKSKIWADINKAPADETSEEKTPVVQITEAESRKDSRGFNWGWAAAIIATIGIAGIGYQGIQKDQQIASLIDDQDKRQEVVNEELAKIKVELTSRDELIADMRSDMGILQDSRYLPIHMKGTDNAPTAFAQVYWNSESADTYLSVESMAELPKGKVYQLWALDDGVPVDAGTFSADISGLVQMKSIKSGQAFAVTIEDEGGAESPSLETLQVIGEV